MDIGYLVFEFFFIWLPITSGVIYILAAIYSMITGSKIAEYLEGDSCCNYHEDDDCTFISELDCPALYKAINNDD
jgi:hypothetical protein